MKMCIQKEMNWGCFKMLRIMQNWVRKKRLFIHGLSIFIETLKMGTIFKYICDYVVREKIFFRENKFDIFIHNNGNGKFCLFHRSMIASISFSISSFLFLFHLIRFHHSSGASFFYFYVFLSFEKYQVWMDWWRIF